MDLRETLEEFCVNVKNIHGSEIPSPVVTNRASFIMKKISELGLTYTLDRFLPSYYYETESRFYNIIVKFPAADSSVEEGIMFTAHHDIRNVNSENCQDNSASVVNLLKLCSLLKEKNDLKQNVYVVFTDCEEFGGKGAVRITEQILNGEFGKIKYIVNSELTAFGEYIWCEEVGFNSNLRGLLQEKLGDNFRERTAPFNDSVIFRFRNIDSVCLGILPLRKDGSLDISLWRICHSDDDSIIQANYEHMNNYVLFLFSLV